MYNSGFRSNKKTPDGVGTVAMQAAFVQKSDPSPAILSWSIQGSDDRALDPAGGQTVVVNGAGFTSGMTVTVGTSAIGAVTIVNSSQATFTAPAKAAGNYTLTMANANGQAAILVPGLAYSTIVTWTTPAGSIGTTYETAAFTESVVATADSAITYTLASGSLPTGATLNANGVITGTAATTASPTTYSFSITATDAELQDSTQSFTITVSPDVVTWVSPTNNTSYNLTGNQAMANVTLSAISAAGSGITYAANALPTGVSLTGNVIYGTPTVAETVSTLLTATANTTTRSSTETITWTVSVGDIYWPYVSMLLNGSTPTTTFINDASLNNNALTIAGDTKPNLFNPYAGGYYSNYFDGTGDYLTVSSFSGLGSGEFTVEFYWYPTILGRAYELLDYSFRNTTFSMLTDYMGASSTIFYIYVAGVQTHAHTVSQSLFNKWNHIALVRNSSNIVTLYVNGIAYAGYGAAAAGPVGANALYIGGANIPLPSAGYDYQAGYVSNLRSVVGTAVYTTAFTPSTTPLTAVSGTNLLTCQSSRLIDNSVNNFVITKNGDTTVSSAYPFTTPTTSSYNTQYSTYFDGTGDYITVPNNVNNQLSGSQYTIEMWLYPTATGTERRIFNKNGAGTYGYLVYLSTADVVAFRTDSTNMSTGALTAPVGTWTHVAVTNDGTTTRIFVNGVLSTSATGVTITNANELGDLAIGARQYLGGNAFTGYMSNVRLIKGSALYTTNFTVPTSPLTAVANTSLLTCQNSTLIDNSTNALAITSYADARPIAVSPFTMTTSTNTLTSLGSTYFDGTGDYLSNSTLPAIGAGDFTVECWVYTNAITNAATVFAVGDQLAAPYTNVALLFNGTTYWQLYVSGATNIVNWSTTVPLSTYPPLNTWQHHAVSRSGTTLSWYINGIQVATTASGSGTMSMTNILIGYSTGIGGVAFNGRVSDFRIVKGTALYTANFLPPQAPLTPVTNTSLLTCQYNGGANNNGFVDQSSFNNIITRNGNTTQGTFSPYSQTGWSNYFNGSSDYFTVPNNTGLQLTGAFTIEAWVNYSTAPTTQQVWLSRGSSGAGTWSIGTVGSSNSRTRFYYDAAGTGITFDTSLSSNTWYHIALVRDGSNVVSCFINGVKESTTSTVATSFNVATTTNIGVSRGIGAPWFNGYLSNLRIINGTALYTTNFTPSTTPLAPISGTQLLTCQSPRFIDNSVNNATVTIGSAPTVQAYSPFGGVTSVPTSYSTYFGDAAYCNLIGPAGSAAAVDMAGAWTMEGWFYLTAAPASSLYGCPVMCTASTTNISSNWVYRGFYGANQFQWYNRAGAAAVLLTMSQNTPLNQWFHFALVMDSGTTATAYLNGTNVGTATDSSTYSGQPAYYLSIGSATSSGAGGYFDGSMSNLRMSNIARYTNNFTVSTSPLTADANTTLLVCQSNTFIDNSSNKYTFTPNVNGNSSKILSYNPFGNTNTSLVSYTPAVNGGSMYFDGTGDYLTAPSNAIFGFGTNNFTMECWVYLTTSFSSGPSLIDMRNGTANAVAPLLYVFSDGVVTYYVSGAARITGATLSLNTWYHLAVVRSSGVTTLYVNGVKSGTPYTDTNNYITNGPVFGKYSDSAGGYVTGYMSDIRITNGTALYTANFYPGSAPATPTVTIGASTYASNLLLNGTSGGIIDYHSTNDLETVGNTQLAPQDPYAGSYYSNYFNGSTDYLQTPSTGQPTMAGDFTVSAWVYLTAYDAIRSWIIDNFGSSSTAIWGMSVGSTGGLQIWYDSFSAAKIAGAVGQVPLNTWTYVAFTRSGTTITSYVNGVAFGTTGTKSTTFGSASIALTIGAYNTTQLVNGYISNLRILDGVVDTAVPTSPFTATSGVKLLTCQSNKFVDNSTNAYTITPTGTPKVQSQNPFQQNTGKSLYFDGTGDYLVTPSTQNATLGTGNFTVECWYYYTGGAPGSKQLTLLSNLVANDNVTWDLQYYSGSFRFVAWSANFISATASLVANTWNYIAITRQGTTLTLWLNGSSIGTTSNSTNFSTVSALKVGYNGTNDYWQGYITDARITKGVARYTTTFTPPTSPDQTN